MDNGIGKWNYKQATINPRRTALVREDTGQQLTYADLNARSNRLARSLEDAGIGGGDRVIVLSTNSIEFLEALFAIAKVGAISVPVNFRLAGPEVAFIASDCRPKAVIASANLTELVAAAYADERVDIPLTIITELRGAPLPAIEGTEVRDFEELMAAGSPEDDERDVEKSDIGMIMYTSGTTGRPKGAMLTHANIEANNYNIMGMAPGISKLDVTTTPCPLFHVGGLNVHTFPLLFLGGKVVVLPAFDPAGALKSMADNRATVQFLVPAMWAAITAVPNFDSYDVSAMRFGMAGGAPSPLTVIEFFQNKGWMFFEGFGMTETCAGALVISPEDTVERRGSVGQPALLTDARVVNELDEDVAVGEIGELVMRGDNIFAGYFEMPEATQEALRGGWFHSGDLARVDEDGFYTLVDRKKDMIISGGENVYPIEVEQVLHRHESILDVAVIGVPDEKWGESVVAVVVPKPNAQLSGDEVIDYARERLAHYKSPRAVEFIDELPRNATGKILKRTLRERFAGQGEAVSR
ncbi:long-chain-fatty-acid--CoA ligase [Epidermidibacterium keratini]|uniref:Long-chain-fatty-acid--CoA ligase n=1 Tax=Epidermidibacterium keratini TaxID=1891644 RepID=A0A7L4YM04_9ACTN|nr:long-chain fatty acid--CoA ligase [Epidermidibacterium keratini]QHC00315.1 long-chain-fatty-acid--CoA ligase [Epidermidibacterium keratini]